MSVESDVVFALVLLYFALSCRFLDQSEEKPKPIVTCLHAFPALDKLLDLAQFLIGSFCFFVSVAIGWSNYFGFRFTTLIWKPFYL